MEVSGSGRKRQEARRREERGQETRNARRAPGDKGPHQEVRGGAWGDGAQGKAVGGGGKW